MAILHFGAETAVTETKREPEEWTEDTQYHQTRDKGTYNYWAHLDRFEEYASEVL